MPFGAATRGNNYKDSLSINHVIVFVHQAKFCQEASMRVSTRACPACQR